jgi:menaquinone-specific isochorismate synthase
LAGTCPKEDSAGRPSLLEDPKELQEHELVVQDIDEVLGAFGSVKKSKIHLLELPTLWHLKTDLSVPVGHKLDVIELALRMHPTPALGVSPRSAGYHWMQAYADQSKRGRFGAPFMFVFPDKNEAICLVAIRNLQWNKEEVLLGSGAGVVAASLLEREWSELSQKRESVKRILNV